MLLFGLVQIVMSQIPDFHKMEWLSVVAAMMSFTYSFIGIALGFAKVIGMDVFALFFFNHRPPILQLKHTLSSHKAV